MAFLERNLLMDNPSVIGHESYRIRRNNAKYGYYAVQRRSRSFKVTNFGTNRKAIYDFLLVINTK